MYYRGRTVPLSGGVKASFWRDRAESRSDRRGEEKKTVFRMSWSSEERDTVVQGRAPSAPFYRSRGSWVDKARTGRTEPLPERSAMGDRLDRRPAPAHRTASPGRRKIGWRALLFLALAVVVVWAKGRVTEGLQNAANLKLSQVKVTGVHYLEEGQIREAAGLPLGENMYKLNLSAAQGRVQSLGWVDRVYLERRLPRTLVVAVRERRPVALLDSFHLYGVDKAGRILPGSRMLPEEDLPLLSGVDVPADAVGTTRLANQLKPGLDFLAFLAKKDPTLAKDVSEISLEERGTLKVTFMDGVEARFGFQVTEMELKRMGAVLSDLGSKGRRAAAMDFRYMDSVFVKTRD